VNLTALMAYAKQVDEATFLREHPYPQLVIKRRTKDEELGFDTELDWRTRTKKGMYSGASGSATGSGARGMRPPSHRSQLKTALCEPLVKSTRNPYAGMITVGRAPNNDVCIPMGSVSKLHAYFQNEGANWVLRDSHSSFGTFVNDTKVHPDKPHPIENGTQISFGPDTDCLFKTPKGLYAYLIGLSKLENPPT
jgi:hypothetical protein